MAPRSEHVVLELKDIDLVYRQGTREIHVLRGATANVRAGEIVALLGPSGAGKSSLLHIVGLLDRARGGTVVLEGCDCTALDDDAQTLVRREKIGFVYQFHHLLPEFSALENVAMPQLIAGRSREEAEERAQELLAALGLAERTEHRPPELSGGEQQRVAVARAVANRPRILLADEPTGNLDPSTAERVFGQLTRLVEAEGLTAIIATHNLDLARRMNRVWRLQEGLIQEVSPAKL